MTPEKKALRELWQDIADIHDAYREEGVPVPLPPAQAQEEPRLSVRLFDALNALPSWNHHEGGLVLNKAAALLTARSLVQKYVDLAASPRPAEPETEPFVCRCSQPGHCICPVSLADLKKPPQADTGTLEARIDFALEHTSIVSDDQIKLLEDCRDALRSQDTTPITALVTRAKSEVRAWKQALADSDGASDEAAAYVTAWTRVVEELEAALRTPRCVCHSGSVCSIACEQGKHHDGCTPETGAPR